MHAIAPLPSGEVHFWFLPNTSASIGQMRAVGLDTLSSHEMQRFEGMGRREPAERFLVGRIFLRRILGHYTGLPAASFSFRYNSNGKPELGGILPIQLSFNLSHSKLDTVVAVSSMAALGVDLEMIDRADATYRISQRYFSQTECRQLRKCGEFGKMQSLILWSLKESVTKANGSAIWRALSGLPLLIDGHQISCSSLSGSDGFVWKLAAGRVGISHMRAIAVKARGHTLAMSVNYKTFRLRNGTEMIPVEIDAFQPEFSS